MALLGTKPVEITLKMSDLRFDYQAVRKAADRAQKESMQKQLSFIRQTTKRDVLKRRKKPSRPGNPPHVHAKGQRGLKLIFYVMRDNYRNGIVGPIRKENRSPGIKLTGTVPNLLEFGGTYVVTEYRRQGWKRWRTVGHKFRKRRDTEMRRRTVTIAPRPFMQKGLEIEVERGTIMDPWVGVFRE